MLVLIEQHQLINDTGAQRQPLRVPQALHRHLRAPLKDILEQTIERFNGLQTELMENTPHLHHDDVVEVCPTSGRPQYPMGVLAQATHLWIIIVAIPQDIACLGRQGSQQLDMTDELRYGR